MKNAPVTVVMSTYNRELYIEEALNGIINQSLPPKQIIVVNDGSTDSTSEILKKFKDRVTYCEQPNSGKSVALNFALNFATEDYIWVFDDDDVPFIDALEKHMSHINLYPGADFTYSSYVLWNSEMNSDFLSEKYKPLPDIEDGCLFYNFLDHCFILQQGCLLKKSCIDSIGGFREDLFRSLDYEFMLRFVRKYEGLRVECPTFYLRVHSGSRGTKSKSIDYKQRQYAWFNNDKKIFRELYETLNLNEYLPKNLCCDDTFLSEQDKSHALLKRISVMGRRGLWDIVSNDIDFFIDNKYYELIPDTYIRQRFEFIFENSNMINELIEDKDSLNKIIDFLKKINITETKVVCARSIFYAYKQSSDILLIYKVKIIIKMLGFKGMCYVFVKKILEILRLKEFTGRINF